MKTAAALLLLLAAPALAAPLPAAMHAPAAGVQVAQAAATRTYRNAEMGYRLAFPGDWTATPGDGTDNNVRLTLTPATTGAVCTVAIADSERFRGLSQAQLDWSIANHPWFLEDWTDSLGTRFTNVTIKTPATIKIGPRPARYAMADATDAKGAPTQLLMFHAITPGRTWHFTCGASGADAAAATAAFNARRNEFMRVMSTFAWDN